MSKQDKILSLAGFLTGRKPRLGVLVREEDLQGLDVTVVDFTELGDGEGYNHFVPMTSPAAITAINGMINRRTGIGRGPLKFLTLNAQQ